MVGEGEKGELGVVDSWGMRFICDSGREKAMSVFVSFMRVELQAERYFALFGFRSRAFELLHAHVLRYETAQTAWHFET